MQNKKFTNEDVARALGWLCFYKGLKNDYVGSVWDIVPPIGPDGRIPLPDFKDENNAFKYVVPKLVKLYDDKRFPHRRICRIIEGALDDGKSISIALCEDLMEWEELCYK